MIEDIKKNLETKLNKKVKVCVNEGRSKKTIYEGILKEMYSNIFLIENEENKFCYTYTDVLTKKIILK